MHDAADAGRRLASNRFQVPMALTCMVAASSVATERSMPARCTTKSIPRQGRVQRRGIAQVGLDMVSRRIGPWITGRADIQHARRVVTPAPAPRIAQAGQAHR